MRFEVTLPFPPSTLNPNRKGHWAKVAKAKRDYRSQCWLYSVEAGAGRATLPEGRLALWLEFYPPDRRKRDDDNMIASFKAGRDGLADALGIDDSRFQVFPLVMTEVGGMVKVVVTELPSKEDA